MKNGKSKYVLIKRLIVHATTAKTTVTKRYMHLWHICLAMTNIQVEIMVIVCKFTNWIFNYGATCHMTPEISDFITGSLEDTDKYIEVVDGYHVTAKQKGRVSKFATITESLSSQHYTTYF